MIFPVFLPIDRFWKKIFLGLIFLTYRGPFKALYETKLLPTGVPPTWYSLFTNQLMLSFHELLMLSSIHISCCMEGYMTLIIPMTQ